MVLAALLCAALVALCACKSSAQTVPETTTQEVNWPRERLALNEDGVPMLEVYVVGEEQLKTMDVETYVQGVLAGEMKNDWPLGALKAQAILARTFVLKFVSEKQSRYPGADISTDIEEAQAYDAAAVNDRIRQAVRETRGQVLACEGELPYAWFHAHAGGVTELAKVGLGWEGEEPAYTQVTDGREPEAVDGADAQALLDAQAWEATFTAEEFEAACAKSGVEIMLDNDSQLSIAQRGASGRAEVVEVDGRPVNAASLRIALGSTKMRSTLLTSLRIENSDVVMAGKGYGHGVGMSQWGAYAMASEGAKAADIVKHYFRNVEIVSLW